MANIIWRNWRSVSVILLLIFAGGFLIAASAALIRAVPWQPMLATNQAPPNGTPGSAQPGTLGMARPHPPIQVR
jgi:amino acid transporter